MSDLSGVFSCSTARSWSYLPIFDEAIVESDPYRSRNTVAHAQKAYQKGFFKNLVYHREVAEGAVFTVALYGNTPRKQLFAVKKPKFVKQAGKTVGPDKLRKKAVVGEGVYLAFKEIQIISHNLLREHINIVDIIGWDWASDREPAIIVEYAEYGTLQEFLQEQRDHLGSNERRQLCLDVACGLSALHAADVAHGDIKATNVLVFRSSKDEWLAKLSDFSHAMFGLSLQRKTTYPGSGVYNAPEIRKRDVLISSDKVPCCEAFSFGLLVWEVLLDGVSFLHGNSIVSSVGTSIEDPSRDGRTADLLNELPQDELLKWAQISLLHLRTIRPFDKPLYSHIFDMTLQDRPWRRKDLATLATRLDEFDSGSICHFSSQTAVAPYAAWNFEPWADIDWQEKTITLREKGNIVSGPRESHHAEMFLILSRCFAEGYGCTVDLKQAVKNLYNSAFNDCADATCILELSPQLLTAIDSSERITLGSNSVSDAFRVLKRKQAKMARIAGRNRGSRASLIPDNNADALSTILRLWLAETRERVCSLPFQYQIGRRSDSSSWSPAEIVALHKEVKETGLDICDLFIVFQNLTNPVNTATYFEVCAKYGIRQALVTGLALLQDVDIENSSWGTLNALWEMLLIEAAKGGCRASLEYIIDYVNGSVEGDASSLEWTNSTGESPLHFLSFVEGTEEEIAVIIVKLLELGFGVDSSIRTKTWFCPFGLEVRGTPLQMAVKCGCLRTTRALVSKRARVMEKGVLPLNPLELACSLHFSDIVHTLLASLPLQKRHYGDILRTIGHPTPRGWFDRLPVLSSNSTNIRIEGTLKAMEGCFAQHEPLTTHEHWKQWLSKTDGAALTSAIRAGQRDQDLIVAMVNCGLGPVTHDGRFVLLSAITSLDKADTNRKALLKAVLGRAYPVFVKTEPPFVNWSKEWPSFFKEYRYTWNPQNQKVTMLHLWVIISDEESLQIAQDVCPESVAIMADIRDGNGGSAHERAIDMGSLAMYKHLRKYRKHGVQEDIARAEKSSTILRTNPLLPFLHAEARREIESHHITEIGHRLKASQSGRAFSSGTAAGEIATRLEDYGVWLNGTYPKRWSQIESLFLASLIWRVLQLQGQLTQFLERTSRGGNCNMLLHQMTEQRLAQLITDSILGEGASLVKIPGILTRHYVETRSNLRLNRRSSSSGSMIIDIIEQGARSMEKYQPVFEYQPQKDVNGADEMDPTEKARKGYANKLLEREIDTLERVLKRIIQFEAMPHLWMRTEFKFAPGVAGVLNWFMHCSEGKNAAELEQALNDG